MTENLRVFTKDELFAILKKHAEWLEDSDKGERANLRYADLRYADLSSANLSSANLSSADLSSANLSSANLRYANLRSANLILIGQDIRGYLFYGFKNETDVMIIRAGCRQFVGISAARNHWTERHTDDEVLHADCLSLIDRAEKMAIVRGWKLEPEV